MATINANFLKLKAGYLFPEIARRVKAFTEEHPDKAARVIRCGIGDVTEPLPPAVVKAMHEGVDEMAVRETFKGYGPEQGYEFLRQAIAETISSTDSASRRTKFSSPTARSATPATSSTFSATDIRLAIPDPVYPVYLDTNVMAGRTGGFSDGRYAGVHYLDSTPETVSCPRSRPNRPISSTSASPTIRPGRWPRANNLPPGWPTPGSIGRSSCSTPPTRHASRTRDPALIFEIEGAARVAIEFRRVFQAGRLYRDALRVCYHPENGHRQGTGRRARAAAPPVVAQAHHQVQRRELSRNKKPPPPCFQRKAGTGGRAHLPLHGQCETPAGEVAAAAGGIRRRERSLMSGSDARTGRSWGMFDKMLHEAQVVITPGAGFGAAGEGWFRISAFNSRANVKEVCRRLAALFGK